MRRAACVPSSRPKPAPAPDPKSSRGRFLRFLDGGPPLFRGQNLPCRNKGPGISIDFDHARSDFEAARRQILPTSTKPLSKNGVVSRGNATWLLRTLRDSGTCVRFTQAGTELPAHPGNRGKPAAAPPERGAYSASCMATKLPVPEGSPH
jgi:hypothetical protein